VRNDPFLTTSPKVVGLEYQRGKWPHVRDVPQSARGRIHQLTTQELARLGVPVFEPPRPQGR
jgi:hypothetical protein